MPFSQYLILREKRRFAKGLNQEPRLSARNCESSPLLTRRAMPASSQNSHPAQREKNVYFPFSLLEHYRFAFCLALKKL